MDAKDLSTESGLGERNDGSKYSQSGVALQSVRNKSYQDIGTNPLAKAEVAVRPCAVIGPDRVLPAPPSTDAFHKKTSVELWTENVYPRPPEYPHKHLNNVNPTRNISPRQTFQENMQRILVPPTYSAVRHTDDPASYTHDRNAAVSKIKPTMAPEAKYSDVPYPVNLLTNEHKNVRPNEMCVPSVNSPLSQTAHGWTPSGVNLPASRAYGAHDVYQYPQYSNYAGTRPPVMPIARPHRTFQEERYGYPEAIYQDVSVRFKPYPTVKDRYPQSRYDYVTNYPNPFHPPPPYGPPKYDISNARPHPYPVYPHMKYLDNRIPDPNIEGYQRPTQQSINYNMQFRNQIIHPTFAPGVGNPQSKVLSYSDSMKSSNKLPIDNNKAFVDYENAKAKYPQTDSYFVNEIARGHQAKAQAMQNYVSPGLHPVPIQQYHRKDLPLKTYEYMPHYRHYEHPLGFNPLIHHQPQFSPNTLAISPTDSNTSNDTTQTQGTLQEDCGYVSQSSSASVRSVESNIKRLPNEYYRRFDYRYRPIIGSSHIQPRVELTPNSTKGSDKIDVRQFLTMWNEGDEDCGTNNSKEVTGSSSASGQNAYIKRQEAQKTQEELYVLGLVNVPSEELSKYEHIQRISKLPENIKGYDCIEILNQFEEVIESTNINSYKSPPSRDYMKCKNALKQMVEALPRPVSPLDVEAKISQSVIHKEVGCNFEIKPCSPMMNVEVAAPVQNILSERIIEKVSNPHSNKANSPTTIRVEGNTACNKMQGQESTHTAYDSPSCKMVGSPFMGNNMESNYSFQDLETSSGVCLASLPRLDNEIELNFPEVNQQFINANKVDHSPIRKHSQDSIQDSLKFTSLNENNTSTQTDPEQYANTIQDEKAVLTKLSKYRKVKVNNLECLEEEPNTNAIRTDSVIIQNPENVRRNEGNKEKISSHRTVEEEELSPINLTSQSRDGEIKKVMHNEFALDFSTTRSGNGMPIINEDETVKPKKENAACDNVPAETNTTADIKDSPHIKSYNDANERDSICENVTSITMMKNSSTGSNCEIEHNTPRGNQTAVFHDNLECIDNVINNQESKLSSHESCPDKVSSELNIKDVTYSIGNTSAIVKNKYANEIEPLENSHLNLEMSENEDNQQRSLIKIKKLSNLGHIKCKSKLRKKTKADKQNKDSFTINKKSDKFNFDALKIKNIELNSELQNQSSYVPKIDNHENNVDARPDNNLLAEAKHTEHCSKMYDKSKMEGGMDDTGFVTQTCSKANVSDKKETNDLLSDHAKKYYTDLISVNELFVNNKSPDSVNQSRFLASLASNAEEDLSNAANVSDNLTDNNELVCFKIQSDMSNLHENASMDHGMSKILEPDDASSSHEDELYQDIVSSNSVTILDGKPCNFIDGQSDVESCSDKIPNKSVEASISSRNCIVEENSQEIDVSECANNNTQLISEGTNSKVNDTVVRKTMQLDLELTTGTKHIDSGYQIHKNSFTDSDMIEHSIDALVNSNEVKTFYKCTQATSGTGTGEVNLNDIDKGSDQNITPKFVSDISNATLCNSFTSGSVTQKDIKNNQNMEITVESAQIPKLQSLCKKFLHNNVRYSEIKILMASETVGGANDTPEILDPHKIIGQNEEKNEESIYDINLADKSEKNDDYDFETKIKHNINNKLCENSHGIVSESAVTMEIDKQTSKSSNFKENTEVFVAMHGTNYSAYMGKKLNSPYIQKLMMYTEGKIYDVHMKEDEVVTELQDDEKKEENVIEKSNIDNVIEETTWNHNENYSKADVDLYQDEVGCEVMNSELKADLADSSKDGLSFHDDNILCDENDINKNDSKCDADLVQDDVCCELVNFKLIAHNSAKLPKDELSCLPSGILCDENEINKLNEGIKISINETPFDNPNKSELEEVSIEQCDVPNDLINNTDISFSYPNSSIISQITENTFETSDNMLELECTEHNEKQQANFENINISINQRRSLKRSFSDPALNTNVSQSTDNSIVQYTWPRKRNRIGEFQNLMTNNRRNSVNIEGNVSFCILIDDTCIISEENEEKICISGLQEDYITAIETGNDEANTDSLKEPISRLHDSNIDYTESVIVECEENDPIQNSWIDDIGCVETVFSDEVAENVIISAASSPTDSTSENECDVSTAICSDIGYNQSDKVFLGGEVISDNTVLNKESLLCTSVLDMDKALMNKENMDESIRHLSDLDQVKILLGSENWKPSPTHTPDYIDSANTSNDFRLDTPENKENIFVKELSPLRRIDDYLDDSSAENESDESLMPQVESGKVTQDGTVHSCESSLDNVFHYEVKDESISSRTTSCSPEVSSTTSEEKSSSILLKITNLNGSRVSQINESIKRPRCKFTEKKEYSTSDLNFPNGPLITKAAQKYIPPIRESIRDLKVQIPLPQQKLMKLKQLKMSRKEPKVHIANNVIPRVVKKPKPNFDDVLKSIDEIQIKMHKEKNKRNKTAVPKVVIKKSQNGSHYASIPKKDTYNPDLTGRKWQPWVFLERNHFIDKMAIKKKTRAIFSHRKNTFILAEKFAKYKSASSTKFVISQPKTSSSSGQLKYTIRLKHLIIE